MNVNKKLGRLRHWAGEKMGAEVKTTTSDEFKALETEMTLRQEGMERLHKSMGAYVKSLSKGIEGSDKEKTTAIAQLGSVASAHADDFEPESEFGQCLAAFGKANERIARAQDSYVVAANTTWLEGLDRSLAQLKEYNTARKKLESRRLAYDTSQTKMQKSKRDDFKTEEELRSQKAKYEESSEDVYRRMLDVKEAEVDSITDLAAFLDAELEYHDRAREILLQLKQDWPGGPADATPSNQRRKPRSRASTMTAYESSESPLVMPPRPRIVSAQTSAASSPLRERPGFDFPSVNKPGLNRHSTFEGPRSLHHQTSRDNSSPHLSRVPTESSVYSARSTLRPTRTRDSYTGGAGGLHPSSAKLASVSQQQQQDENVFADDPGVAEYDAQYDMRSVSPARSMSASYYSNASDVDLAARGNSDVGLGQRKMAPPPPPPPPSRSKKPPPPLPLKRNAISSSAVPFVR